jgi:hypothetical protein
MPEGRSSLSAAGFSGGLGGQHLRDGVQTLRQLCYQKARDASVWGKADPSLEDTVNGILKFMHRKGIISVAAREVNVVSPSDGLVDR